MTDPKQLISLMKSSSTNTRLGRAEKYTHCSTCRRPRVFKVTDEKEITMYDFKTCDKCRAKNKIYRLNSFYINRMYEDEKIANPNPEKYDDRVRGKRKSKDFVFSDGEDSDVPQASKKKHKIETKRLKGTHFSSLNQEGELSSVEELLEMIHFNRERDIIKLKVDLVVPPHLAPCMDNKNVIELMKLNPENQAKEMKRKLELAEPEIKKFRNNLQQAILIHYVDRILLVLRSIGYVFTLRSSCFNGPCMELHFRCFNDLPRGNRVKRDRPKLKKYLEKQLLRSQKLALKGKKDKKEKQNKFSHLLNSIPAFDPYKLSSVKRAYRRLEAAYRLKNDQMKFFECESKLDILMNPGSGELSVYFTHKHHSTLDNIDVPIVFRGRPSSLKLRKLRDFDKLYHLEEDESDTIPTGSSSNTSGSSGSSDSSNSEEESSSESSSSSSAISDSSSKSKSDVHSKKRNLGSRTLNSASHPSSNARRSSSTSSSTSTSTSTSSSSSNSSSSSDSD